MSKFLRVVCISDTHELHRELDVPDGDLLIHAGDFTMFSKSAAAIRDFNTWLGELPHAHKVICPGNHEFFLESDRSNRSLISNATVLINEGIEVMGLKIWGSPTTSLYGGAFGLSSEVDRRDLYRQIPEGTHILITHGPPLGILDCVPGSPRGAGCEELLHTVKRLQPLLHVYGHVHGAYGLSSDGDTLSVNAALLGRNGNLEERPVTLQMRL